MGKAQRSKNKKAVDQLGNPAAYVKADKSGLATKIGLAVLSAIIALVLIIMFISSSGIFIRANKAIKSDNIKIDGAMMQYLYNAQINDFVSTYYQYIYLYSQMGLEIIDLSAPLDSQNINDSAKSMFGITADGTWHDYFWSNTEVLAKRIVVLCESAKAEGVYDALAAEAETLVNENIEGYKEAAKKNSMTLSAYFATVFGEGVKKSDVKKIETLQQIASLYYEDKYEEIKTQVYADKAGITKQYEDNKSTYLMADYIVASFKANLKSNPTDADKADFLKEIEEIRAHADAISKLDSVEAINKYLANYWVTDTYAEVFKKAFADAKLTEKAPKDTEEKYTEIKDKIIAEVLAKGLDEEYDATKVVTLFNSVDYPEIAATLNSITKNLITTVKTGIEEIQIEGEKHSDKTDKAKWLFAEDRKAGDISIFYGSGESKEDNFNENSDKSYIVNVLYVTDPVHRDETPSVEFGHILLTTKGEFKDEIKQKEKLIALKEQFVAGGSITKEAFEALGKDVTEDSSVIYSDVCPGDMVKEMNNWLFAEDRKAGDMDIVKTEYGNHLVYFVGANAEEPAWFVKAKVDLLATTFENWYKALEESYNSSITINDNVENQVVVGDFIRGYAY